MFILVSYMKKDDGALDKPEVFGNTRDKDTAEKFLDMKKGECRLMDDNRVIRIEIIRISIDNLT